MDIARYEALAFWSASRAVHAAFYEHSVNIEALDELDLIASVSLWAPVRDRCRAVLARTAPQDNVAARA